MRTRQETLIKLLEIIKEYEDKPGINFGRKLSFERFKLNNNDNIEHQIRMYLKKIDPFRSLEENQNPLAFLAASSGGNPENGLEYKDKLYYIGKTREKEFIFYQCNNDKFDLEEKNWLDFLRKVDVEGKDLLDLILEADYLSPYAL